MSECCETFEMRGLNGQALQRFVFENHPAWACESCQCGSESPGPVTNEEQMIFLLVNPTHFDEATGTLHPAAFQEVHNRDLSLIRFDHASKDEIRITIELLLRNNVNLIPEKIRRVEHFATAKAATIRESRDDVDRMFGLYDTPLPDQTSHASVFTRPDILDTKAKKAIARQRLHTIFSSNIREISQLT